MKSVARRYLTVVMAMSSAAFVGCGGGGVQTELRAPAPDTRPKPAVVLVHGAFADGSAWNEVVTRLARDGYTATAVQNPLFSFEQDVANTKRVIENQHGPVIVVGHSYGGAVISAAASGNPNVKALVYVTAFTPERGEPIAKLYESLGKPALLDVITKDSGGFVSIPPARFHDSFANDVSAEMASTLAAAQKPIFGDNFGASLAVEPAWKSIPSWFLVCTDDRAIAPALQRSMAQRAHATVVEVNASHVPFLSHPDVVTQLIETASVAALPVAR